MRRFLLGVFCLFIIYQVYSQDTLRFANSGFEDWVTEEGYTVHTSPIDAKLGFFDEYVRPTEWNRAYYHMNKTISKKVFITVTATIDTDVPIHNFSKETEKVTEGTAAACLSSFQLNDVISSTAIQYGGDYLKNYGLTEDMVCASILSTGNLTRNGSGTYIKQIVNFGLLGCGGTKNEAELYDSIKTYDMNKYVEGGLSLNGFYPTRLHGSYMYKSNSTTDAGEVILLGTHYDTDLKKRLIVGGGYKADMNTAVDEYEEFDVYYRSFVDVEPDSLVIICMSSGLTNCADESKLYLDDMYLLSDCYAVENIVASEISEHSALVAWTENRHVRWEYIYGEKGMVVDEQTPISSDESVIELTNLKPGTAYECYVRTVCSETNTSDWTKVDFTTEASQECEVTSDVMVSDISITGATISWAETESSVEVLLGEKDFSVESENAIVVTDNLYAFSELQSNTAYDVYVRSVCSDVLQSEWTKQSFTTLDYPTCDPISEIALSDVMQNSASIIWDESAFDYEIVYGESGFDKESVENERITSSGYTIEGLALNTSYDVYVRAVKDGYYASEWVKISFVTLDKETCEAVADIVVTDITQAGAVLTWNDSDCDYEIVYGVSGFEKESVENERITSSGYTIEGLALNTSYDVYVRAVKNGYYASEWVKISFVTLDKETCEAVADIVVTDITQTGAALAWSDSDCDYEIVYGVSGFEKESVENERITSSGYTIEGLTLNTSYDVYIRAVKDGYYASEWVKISFVTLDKETCEAVADIVVTDITQTGAVLTWNDSDCDYEIVYGVSGFEKESVENERIESSGYTIEGLALNTSYDVYVRAVKDGYYASEWEMVSFTTNDMSTCVSVSDMTVSDLTESSAVVTWQSDESDVLYEVYYGLGDVDDESRIIEISESFYEMKDLAPNSSYTIAVRAIRDGAYSSQWTKIAFVTDKLTCPAIAEISVTAITDSSVHIAIPFDSEYTYHLVYAESGASVDYTHPVIVTENEYILKNLKSETSYTVYMQAVRDEYYGSPWAQIEFSTLQAEPEVIVLNPVSNIQVIQESSSYIVTWDEMSCDYEVMYGVSGFDTTSANTYMVSDNRYQIPDLSESGMYDVYVRAIGGGRVSSEWTLVSFQYNIAEICMFENVVQNIIADVSDSDVHVVWENPDSNPAYAWFDVALYDRTETVPSPLEGTRIRRVYESNVDYTSLQAMDYVLYIRVGADECAPSEWATVSFTIENGVGFDDLLEQEVCVYPTVTNNLFHVSTDRQSNMDIIIYDLQGSIVKTLLQVSNEVSIQLSQAGVYKVEVLLENKKIVKTVIIK